MILLLTHRFGLSPFRTILQISNRGASKAPLFHTSIGMLSIHVPLLFLNDFMHLLNSSILKSSVLIGSMVSTTLLIGSMLVVYGGLPSRFTKWSSHNLTLSAGLSAFNYPLFNYPHTTLDCLLSIGFSISSTFLSIYFP